MNTDPREEQRRKHGFWELGDELWRVYQCHNHQQVVRGVHLDQNRSEICFSASLKKIEQNCV